MKIIENVTIYKCDFCKKELKRKHAMISHEKKCMNNPDNFRPCLHNCNFLERKSIEYEVGDDYHGEPVYRKAETFFCSLKNQLMLHPKLEYREDGEYLKYVVQDDKQVEQDWMPKSCIEFEFKQVI